MSQSYLSVDDWLERNCEPWKSGQPQPLSATFSPAIPRAGSLPNEVDPAPDFLLPQFTRQEGVAENLE